MVGPKTRKDIANYCGTTNPIGNPPVSVTPPSGGGSGGSGSGSGGSNPTAPTNPAAPPQPASGTLNGATIASGSSQTFYSSQSVTAGSSCSSVAQSRSCTDGTLSGDATYQYSSCAVGAAASCTFNNQATADGASVTAYQSSSVAAGQTCKPLDVDDLNATIINAQQARGFKLL